MSTEMLVLKAEAPLALHLRRASEQFAPTLDYVPGSAVRGALADLYLGGLPGRAHESDFQDLFISGQVAFSDFWPTTPGLARSVNLFPATAMACKRFSEHEPHSLTDCTLRLELASELEQLGPLEHQRWGACPECIALGLDQPQEPKRDRVITGYYDSLESLKRVMVRKRMITGTAIERATGTAAHAMLFSHQVIEESDAHGDVRFRGVVTLPDHLRAELRKLAPFKTRLAVGYGRSRGLGQISVDSWEGAPPAGLRSLKERWTSLNQAAHDLWRLFDREPAGQYFTLTLQSHLALRNVADEPILGDVTAVDLGLPPTAIRRRSVLSALAVPGWNAALDLPKSDTWALARGSVLLFRLPLDLDPTAIMALLEKMEQDGLGERRAEGFGRVIACDPFHSYFLQKELRGVAQ